MAGPDLQQVLGEGAPPRQPVEVRPRARQVEELGGLVRPVRLRARVVEAARARAPRRVSAMTRARVCGWGGEGMAAHLEDVRRGQPATVHLTTLGRRVSESKMLWQVEGCRKSSSLYAVSSVLGGQSDTTRARFSISAMWKAITMAMILLPMPLGENGAK